MRCREEGVRAGRDVLFAQRKKLIVELERPNVAQLWPSDGIAGSVASSTPQPRYVEPISQIDLPCNVPWFGSSEFMEDISSLASASALEFIIEKLDPPKVQIFIFIWWYTITYQYRCAGWYVLIDISTWCL
jgi:hypothetical protein